MSKGARDILTREICRATSMFPAAEGGFVSEDPVEIPPAPPPPKEAAPRASASSGSGGGVAKSVDGRIVPAYVLEAPVDSVWRKVSDRILVCAVPKARFYRSPPKGFKEFRENDSMRDSYSIYGAEIHCEEFDIMWKILDNPRQPVAWGGR
jgi:hypothetical protein